MAGLLQILLLAAGLLCGVAALGVSSGDPANEDLLIRQVTSDAADDLLLNADRHFAAFKARFGKSYDTQEEHDLRFGVFKDNLRRARSNQELDPSAVHGVTQFSDLTPEEFRGYLGLQQPSEAPNDAAYKAPILQTNGLPKEFDWREKGAVTSVKNQGKCGACWSFSASGALEGAHFLANGELVSLSVQQAVDCDHTSNGCDGGLQTKAFAYARGAGGVQLDKDYPYTGRDDGPCKFNKTEIAASVASFGVVSRDENQIAANLVKNGPLSVSLNSGFMQSYTGGVSCPFICSKRVDHGVLLVGYGSYVPRLFLERRYWIIKNSWGGDWGENGYYKICSGQNACGVESMVTTVSAVKHQNHSI